VRPEHWRSRLTACPAEVVSSSRRARYADLLQARRTDITAVVRGGHDFRPGESIRLKPQLTYLFDPSSALDLPEEKT